MLLNKSVNAVRLQMPAFCCDWHTSQLGVVIGGENKRLFVPVLYLQVLLRTEQLYLYIAALYVDLYGSWADVTCFSPCGNPQLPRPCWAMQWLTHNLKCVFVCVWRTCLFECALVQGVRQQTSECACVCMQAYCACVLCVSNVDALSVCRCMYVCVLIFLFSAIRTHSNC